MGDGLEPFATMIDQFLLKVRSHEMVPSEQI
jgi:hypothetical protein